MISSNYGHSRRDHYVGQDPRRREPPERPRRLPAPSSWSRTDVGSYDYCREFYQSEMHYEISESDLDDYSDVYYVENDIASGLHFDNYD